MNNADLEARNRNLLAELDATVREAFDLVLVQMENAGHRIRAQEAYRTPARQRELFLAGLTKRVTGGLHTRRLALDVVDDAHPDNPSPQFMADLAVVAFRQGLTTGLLWGLPRSLAKERRDCIVFGRATQLAALIQFKRGWDASHIEATP